MEMRYGNGAKRWCLGPGYFSRWAALAASFLANAFNSYSYAFGLFSEKMKNDLGFSQVSVDMIASFGELGLWSTFFVGLLLEAMGPRSVYALGSITTLIGLGYVSLAVGEVISSDPASVAGMFFLANFGTACYAQTAASITVRNFPAYDRGKVSGLIKSVFGLSSAVLSVSYSGLFGGRNVESFLLFLSMAVPTLATISSIPLNLIPDKHISYAVERAQGVTPRIFPFYIWFTIVTLFLIAAAATEFLPFSLPSPWTGICVVALVLLVSVVPVLYGRVFIRDAMLAFSRESFNGNGGDDNNGRGGGASNVAMEEDIFQGEISPLLGSRNGLEAENRTWKQCLVDTRFWVLYVSFLCGAGSGLVVINNISSLAHSLEMASSTFLVTALGIANALGRLSAGWVSDRVVGAGLPRSLPLCCMLFVTSGVDFLLVAGSKVLLYPLCATAGICYGTMFALVLALTGDIFGAKHVGTNYGLLDLGPAAGSFIFATGVTSYFYDRAGVNGECVGPQCFASVFVCTAIACLLAGILVFFTLVRPGLKKISKRGEL